MAWITPKTSWIPNDGIANTDFNRIEGNILYNYDTANSDRKRFEISGHYAPSNYGPTPISGTAILQRVEFSLADDENLVLKIARYHFDTVNIKLRVQYNIGAGLVLAWTSVSNKAEETPDITIYSNITGGIVTGYTQIEINTVGPDNVFPYDGWSLTFHKEDVIAVTTTSTTTGAP